jgi:hypothetical protein
MFFPPQTAEKTLTVTVTKNPDDDGAFHITTVDVSTIGKQSNAFIDTDFTTIITQWAININTIDHPTNTNTCRRFIYIGYTTVEVNNVDDDVVPVKELVIITADVFYTPENTDKVITLATNKGGASFTILDDADASKFTLEEGNKCEGFFSRLIALGGFDINTISGITSGFKSRGFES